jgi:hypothetical protein
MIKGSIVAIVSPMRETARSTRLSCLIDRHVAEAECDRCGRHDGNDGRSEEHGRLIRVAAEAVKGAS